MSFFDRLFGKKKEEKPPASRAEAMEKVAEIARRTVPPAQDKTYYFICSGNQSLIRAFHDLFRVGAPAYGGSASLYSADPSRLSARQADPAAASLPFAGQETMGATVQEIATVADVLTKVRFQGFGGIYISHVAVGPNGRNWVQDVYTKLLGEAVRQGILPFTMYTTSSKHAAEFLAGSFNLLSGS